MYTLKQIYQGEKSIHKGVNNSTLSEYKARDKSAY